MQKKIMNLLEMTNASIQLMKDMAGMYSVCILHVHTAIHDNMYINAGCVSEIVQYTNREKNRVLKDLEQ